MAEKKVTGSVKLQIPAGAANPAPPVGPALGAQGSQHHAILPGVQRRYAGAVRHHHPC